MRKAFVFSFVVLTPLLLFLGTLFIALNQLEQPPLAAQAGRRVWQDRGCMECHTIFGNGGYTAKEITGIYAERGAEWLVKFLDQPPMLTPTFHHPRVSGDQLGWLLEFLAYLETIKLSDWPPRPIMPGQGREP